MTKWRRLKDIQDGKPDKETEIKKERNGVNSRLADFEKKYFLFPTLIPTNYINKFSF